MDGMIVLDNGKIGTGSGKGIRGRIAWRGVFLAVDTDRKNRF